MNKVEAMILLGTLEVEFEADEKMLKELSDLEEYIVKNDLLRAAVGFDKLKKMQNLAKSEPKEMGKFEEWLLSQDEKQVTVDSKISKLNLPTRAWNCLDRAGIKTVAQLIEMTPESLKKLRNMTNDTINKVIEQLAVYGFTLAEDNTEVTAE